MAVTLIKQWRRYLGVAGLVLAATASVFLTTNPPSEAASPELLASKAWQGDHQPFPGATTMCVILYDVARCATPH